MSQNSLSRVIAEDPCPELLYFVTTQQQQHLIVHTCILQVCCYILLNHDKSLAAATHCSALCHLQASTLFNHDSTLLHLNNPSRARTKASLPPTTHNSRLCVSHALSSPQSLFSRLPATSMPPPQFRARDRTSPRSFRRNTSSARPPSNLLLCTTTRLPTPARWYGYTTLSWCAVSQTDVGWWFDTIQYREEI
jgi:hypothetical protein